MKEEEKEAKVIQFRTKEQVDSERRFRHLSDHLFANPCFDCRDINSQFCMKECPSRAK